MDKFTAVKELLHEAQSKRCSRAAMLRVERACKALGLRDEEIKLLLSQFGYLDGLGRVFPQYSGTKE